MISVNATLFLQVIHFLVLTLILNRLMFRPILKLINERTRYVEKTKNETENIEWETRQLVRKCVSMEKDARKAAGEERTSLKREANDAAEEILNNTRKETALIRDEVIKEVEVQVRKAQEFVHHEALALADTITEKLIDRRMNH